MRFPVFCSHPMPSFHGAHKDVHYYITSSDNLRSENTGSVTPEANEIQSVVFTRSISKVLFRSHGNIHRSYKISHPLSDTDTEVSNEDVKSY